MSIGDDCRVYVAQARARKAEQMAFLLWAGGFTSEQVSEFTEGQWEMIAAAARVNMPSKETRGLVWNRLGQYEEKGAVAA